MQPQLSLGKESHQEGMSIIYTISKMPVDKILIAVP